MSSALRALALLGAGFGGYARGKQIYEDGEARKEDRAYRNEQRQRERAEYDDAQKLKVSMRDTLKPAIVQDGATVTGLSTQPTVYDSPDIADSDVRQDRMLAERTGGVSMAQAAPSIVVNGKTYGDRASADQAANAYNDPQAQMSRVAGLLLGAGKINEAFALENSARQGRAADMQMKEAEVQAGQRAMLRELGRTYRTGGVDGIAEFATKNYDDGMTYKAAPGKDGAFELVQMDASGKETQRFPFANIDEFVTRVAAEADPTKYVADKRAEAAEDARSAEDKRRFYARLAFDRLSMQQARGAGRSGADGGAGSVSLEDFRKFNGDFASYLPDPKTAVDPVEAQALLAQNARITSQAQAMFQANAGFGTVLTAPEVRAAMERAQDPKNVQVRENDGQRFETVTVNGKVVAVSGALQAPSRTLEPAGAAPATATAPRASMRTATAPTADNRSTVEILDSRTLERLAGIRGHVNQAAAIAELEKRRAAQAETPELQFPN